MNIYEALIMTTTIMVTIMMVSQYMDRKVPKVCDVLQLMNILPCYEIKAFKNGKRIKTSELIQYIKSDVKAYKMKDGILYMKIY